MIRARAGNSTANIVFTSRLKMAILRNLIFAAHVSLIAYYIVGDPHFILIF